MSQAGSSFYNSKAWKECRKSFIKHRQSIDGGICEMCHENPGVIVHHKIHLTQQNATDPNIALNHSNLMYVCHYCHDVIHQNTSQTHPARYRFDANGNMIVMDNTTE